MGRARSRGGGRSDLHEDVAYMVNSSPMLRSEDSAVPGPEIDTLDEVPRAGFWSKGGVENYARSPLKTLP